MAMVFGCCDAWTRTMAIPAVSKRWLGVCQSASTRCGPSLSTWRGRSATGAAPSESPTPGSPGWCSGSRAPLPSSSVGARTCYGRAGPNDRDSVGLTRPDLKIGLHARTAAKRVTLDQKRPLLVLGLCGAPEQCARGAPTGPAGGASWATFGAGGAGPRARYWPRQPRARGRVSRLSELRL